MKRTNWDERSKVKLHALEHFYTRVLNAQMTCEADKKYLVELVTDVQHIMKRDHQVASQEYQRRNEKAGL